MDALSAARKAATAPKEITREAYLAAARRNLMAMSRTAHGVLDTSASAKKAQSLTGVSGRTAAVLAVKNYDAAVNIAFGSRHRVFVSPQDLRTFVEGLALQVNAGIVKKHSLIRSSDSDKYPYCRVANLEKMMDGFYRTLFDMMRDPDRDPVEMAAYAEYTIDLAGHFFADGCGKTAKVVSSFLLMRKNHPLPKYRGGRAEYYSYSQKRIAGEDAEADQMSFAVFLQYYRTLFD